MTVHFQSLYQCISHFHVEIGEILHLHQEALLIQDRALSLSFLRLFKQVLMEHIDLEDTLLLTRHKTLITDPQWATRIYEEEHNKIKTMLKELFVRLNQTPMTNQRRWIIEILDYEKLLKNVLEHHEEREEQGLLKELDNGLGDEEHRELLTHCHLTLQQSLDNIEEDLQQLQTQLPQSSVGS
jgi:hypothetical protein